MNNVKIIATIGPSSNNPEILERLKDRGVSYFRINLSHTDIEDIEQKIQDINKYGIPIILDTEGSQIRSGNRKEITYTDGSEVKIYDKPINCDSKKIFLNPANSVRELREGDLIFIDFNSLILRVYDTSKLESNGYINCKTIISGTIGGRKAVYIDSPSFHLPAFSEKDRKAIALAKKYNIDHFTLSFMSSALDVFEFKKLYPGAIAYAKVESRDGLKNFIEIAKVADGILIDRGDLSHQIPLERIPLIQKHIIRVCRQLGKEIFVATNTLEQMSYSLKPNRAEVNDIINTLLDGATGIALTKETAVGNYPVETVNMLTTLINQIKFLNKNTLEKNILQKIEESNYSYSSKVPGLLIKPHGGILVNRIAHKNYTLKTNLKKIEVSEEIIMDAEQIAIGSFSPIEGFMGRKEISSVLENMRLSNGVVWPLPIILPVDEAVAKNITIGEDISLVYKEDKEVYAIVHVDDIHKINKEIFVQKLYGTKDLEHPGVKKFMNQGEYIIGGKITLLKKRNSPYKMYELTPAQTRRIFTERGWSKVIGFHTRNVIHRSHEFIQIEGLKKSRSDGLFIHPVIGKKKSGDFEADVIMEGYEKMIEKFYPKSKAVLCSFASYSRYAGPREAIFTALVRKNFGCSHFIIGRDHTGVGNFYHPYASHQIFDKFTKDELGIIPVKFDKVFYSSTEKKYLHEPESKNHSDKEKLHISGTQARDMLKKGKVPPKWFMREEISKMLVDKIKNGEKVFVE